jgi:hypothetical protein
VTVPFVSLDVFPIRRRNSNVIQGADQCFRCTRMQRKSGSPLERMQECAHPCGQTAIQHIAHCRVAIREDWPTIKLDNERTSWSKQCVEGLQCPWGVKHWHAFADGNHISLPRPEVFRKHSIGKFLSRAGDKCYSAKEFRRHQRRGRRQGSLVHV